MVLLVGSAVALPLEDEEYDDILCEEGEKFEDFVDVDNPEPYCDKFLVCTEENLVEEFCPDGLVFDIDSRNCDFPQRVDCTGRPLLQPPQNSTGCPRMNGMFGVAGSCKDYYECSSGQGTPQKCADGLVWNQAITQCDWLANLPADSECTQELLDYEEDRLECPENTSPYAYARWAHETECNKFWLCIDGKDRLSGCDEGLVYNPATYKCEEQENVEGACSTYYSPEELEFFRSRG